MSRAAAWFLVALLASPAIAYGVYRLAKELGFLDPPVDRQHELRRTIGLSLFAFLLFLPVGIFGTEKGWPRVWILFGVIDVLAVIFFAAAGGWSAWQLWKIRHPGELSAPAEPVEASPPPLEPADDRPELEN